MNSHDLTLTIYLSIAFCGALLELSSRRFQSRIPGFGALMSWTMSTRTRRVGVIITWAWLGLHCFAR